jgi:glycosyltransferase involved in cell wall biosynthesis
MRIIFDLINVGLGNQGGSLTLIKSANMLQRLGHEVYIIDSMKNQHTWTSLKVKHIIISKHNKIPDADIIIATGYKSWKHTLGLPKRCGKKYIWLRGWEIWNASERDIVSILSNENIIKLVNSSCLKNKLLTYKIKSHIIYPGNDFEDIYHMNIRKNKNKVILGGLYHTRHKTKRSEWIINVVKLLKEKYNNIELYMFGSNKDPKNSVINKYISQPSISKKNKFFNEIDIFLSPSNLEGLHIVPQEAMLAECAVVGTNAELSGMQDYLIHEKTGLVSDNNFQSFSTNVERLVNNENFRKKLGVHGRMKIIEIGDRKTNMKNMVEFFGEYL